MESMLPVTPMVSVTTPATIDRGSKVGEITDPLSHPVFLQHLDIQQDPPKVFLQFAIPHPRSEWITVDILCVQECSGKCRTHSV